jgi:hypothetical protein
MKKINNKELGKSAEESVKKQELSDQQLFEFLITGPRSKANEELSDAELDRKAEQKKLIQLIGGGFVDPLNFLLKIPKAYRRTILPEFYEHTFRLKGWPPENAKKFRKPRAMATYTNELLYNRFHNDTVSAIEAKNPMVSKLDRAFKHFQFLSDEAEARLEIFMIEAIKVMETCTEWYEFRQKMFKEHGVPYQMRLF